MRGIAAKAFARGMNVVRLNQRNCGDTEHLSAGLFHSGLTADARHVIDELVGGRRPAGDRGRRLLARRQPGAEAGRRIRRRAAAGAAAVAAVSPILEIGECVHALERPGNWLYQWNFVRDLKGRMRRKDALLARRFDLSKLKAVRTVRDFDEVYTAPHFGFAGAEDYYHRASAMRVVDRIRVPALIITADDDPFVPSQPFRDPARHRQSAHHAAAVAARRPLRLRRPAGGPTTTATGRRTRSSSSSPRHASSADDRPQALLHGDVSRFRAPSRAVIRDDHATTTCPAAREAWRRTRGLSPLPRA